jgi:hypothetical protein
MSSMTRRATVQQRTLQQAREVFGGSDGLREILRVQSEELARWLDGTEPVPSWAFLRAVDIVNSAEQAIYQGQIKPGPKAQQFGL